MVRGFIKEGKKDITTWITAEGEMVTSILSFELKGSAIENMQAIEDCEMLALTLVDLEKLYEQFPEFNTVSRKLFSNITAMPKEGHLLHDSPTQKLSINNF